MLEFDLSFAFIAHAFEELGVAALRNVVLVGYVVIGKVGAERQFSNV